MRELIECGIVVCLSGGMTGCGNGGASPVKALDLAMGAPDFTFPRMIPPDLHGVDMVPIADLTALDLTPSPLLRSANLPLGGDPDALAAGDLNGDGKLDLVISVPARSTIEVALGVGDGTFRPGTTFKGSLDLSSVRLADLDRDGRLDLVFSEGKMKRVAVAHGDGDGTFSAIRYAPTTVDPTNLDVADFNGDGKLDVVTAGYSMTGIALLIGNGDGTLKAPNIVPLDAGGNRIFGVDLNGDGKLDLASLGVVGPVDLLVAKGPGAYSSSQRLSAVGFGGWMVPVDWDGDGKVDLITAGQFTGQKDSVVSYRGRGDGTVAYSWSTMTAGSNFVVSADFDGDGKPDFVASYAESPGLFFGYNNQRAQNFVLGGKGSAITTGDWNGDGRIDLAVAEHSGQVEVFVNRSL